MTPRHVAVIDIGKTNAKLALVETQAFAEVEVVTTPNTVLDGPPYPHFDVEAIWAFVLGGLSAFHAKHGVDALSVTTHGASGALLATDGALAAPILDYEHTGPDAVAAAYDALRPDFEQTGSPRLPMGLNLGAQLHWQFSQDAGLLDRTASIVTYPQFWGHRLTGVAACDVSSLGCHTDLWNPFDGALSSLVDRLSIREKMAPARKPTELLGPILPHVAAQTGLRPDTPVFCGIHDSNASLLPHILRRDPPFSVVSTGTWVVAMTVGGNAVALDPGRDTLVNVDATGAPVPSARFMGGREYEIVQGGPSSAAAASSLDRLALLLPAVVPDSGPFQGQTARWVGQEPELGSADRAVALGFYLALMTAECLSLTGHSGHVIVEGPFAKNTDFCTMLSAATGCRVIAADSSTGTSQGAAMLTSAIAKDYKGLDELHFHPYDTAGLDTYANRWRNAVRRV